MLRRAVVKSRDARREAHLLRHARGLHGRIRAHATQLVAQLMQLVRDVLANAAEAAGLHALWRHAAELLCGGRGQHSNEEEESEHIRHIL